MSVSRSGFKSDIAEAPLPIHLEQRTDAPPDLRGHEASIFLPARKGDPVDHAAVINDLDVLAQEL